MLEVSISTDKIGYLITYHISDNKVLIQEQKKCSKEIQKKGNDPLVLVNLNLEFCSNF